RGVELIEGHPGRGDDDEFAAADADGSRFAGGGGGTGGDGTGDQADVSAFLFEQHEKHSLCDRGDLLISSHFGTHRARVLGAVRGGGPWGFPSLCRPHTFTGLCLRARVSSLFVPAVGRSAPTEESTRGVGAF